MFGRSKKPVSLEYKEKLLADIAYYEKRIKDVLHKRIPNPPQAQDVESSDEESNPYTVNVGPFPMELKREEARLSSCVSMTLELAMLTIMQSEVNVMAAAPDVRRPVVEDGTWLEVAAECKIDLVSFTITFYAHKPHRKFAPTRYRGLQVALAKAAHEAELAQSVLARLTQPHLALQVLQSYATAFRSRRSSLLELAEAYAGSLRMEALPGGGYRVRFLELLAVEWTLENAWSPVVPFCHRMRFQLEYMPKQYIHAIGKLYARFKEPALGTAARTATLAAILDACAAAARPAQSLRDGLDSDPETAGRLHERRTTIDQEPEVPSNCDQNIQLSPQKLPKGKENKAQNRKTTMAPPKSLPKKAKKGGSVTNKANNEVNDENASKSSKTNDRATSDDATKKMKPNETGDVIENRKGVKRTIDNDVTSNAKKIRSDNIKGGEATEKMTENDKEVSIRSSKKNSQKKDSANSKGKGDKDTDVNSESDGTKKKADTSKKNGNTKNLNEDSEVRPKNAPKKDGTSKITANPKDKDPKINVAISKNEAKEKRDAGSVASSKTVKKVAATNGGKTVASKEQSKEGSVASSKNSKKGEDGKSIASKEQGTEGSVASSKYRKKGEDGKSVASKEQSTESSVASSKNSKKGEGGKSVASKEQGTEGSVASSKYSKKGEGGKSVASSKAASETYSTGGGSSKDLKRKINDEKSKAPSKASKDTTSTASAKNKNTIEKDPNGHNIDKPTAVVEKTKVNPKRKTPDDNEKEESSKAAVNNKVIVSKTIKDTEQIAKRKEVKEVTEKSIKPKQNIDKVVSKNNDKNKELVREGTGKKNVGNTKNIEKTTNTNTNADIVDNTRKINKTKEPLSQKITKPNPEATKNIKNDANKKSTKSIVPKVNKTQDNDKNKATTPNTNETVDKVVESNKFTAKNSINNMKNQDRNKGDKVLNVIPRNTVSEITKSNVNRINVHTDKPNLQKLKENQLRVAEKLQTRIPMMKNKLKIGNFNKVGSSERKFGSKVEKTRIPLKSLPVFKKIVGNPTRMSPRKLTSTIKPSSHGFSNK